MKGLTHIYCGDGKGKTTAAVGLSVRAAGSGMKVLFAQFFKSGKSSEMNILEKLDNITIVHASKHFGRYSKLTEEEKQACAKTYGDLLDQIILLTRSGEYRMIVLDEVISAYNHGVISKAELLGLITDRPSDTELVLTGRNPDEKLMDAADYVSEIRKLKHPYDRGIRARLGIEL